MSEDKISSQMERLLEIRRQLEALLPKEGLDREELIKALGQICPGKSAGELAHACEKMEQGIRNGSAELKYYMEVKDLDVLLEDKLKECTAQLTDAQKRGFLMKLSVPDFPQRSGVCGFSGEMARFLAEMPEEDLQEGLHELLKGEAAILASREMEQFLKAAQESLIEEEFQPSGQRTQEEEWLLTAASIYAGSVNGESDAGLALYPETIGKNVGAHGPGCHGSCLPGRRADSRNGRNDSSGSGNSGDCGCILCILLWSGSFCRSALQFPDCRICI